MNQTGALFPLLATSPDGATAPIIASNIIMKSLCLIVVLAFTCIASAASEKKGAPVAPTVPDLAFAQTWAANAKALVGKPVSTCIQEVLEIGNVASTAPCVVVPVVTGNAKGNVGGEILALVPLPQTESFVKNATASSGGKDTKFGNSAARTVTTGTLAVVEGELVLVVGPSIPVLGGKKPSAMLAEQRGQK